MILTIEVEITRPPSLPPLIAARDKALADALYKTLDPQEIIRFISTMLVTGLPGYRIRVIGDETT